MNFSVCKKQNKISHWKIIENVDQKQWYSELFQPTSRDLQVQQSFTALKLCLQAFK